MTDYTKLIAEAFEQEHPTVSREDWCEGYALGYEAGVDSYNDATDREYDAGYDAGLIDGWNNHIKATRRDPFVVALIAIVSFLLGLATCLPAFGETPAPVVDPLNITTADLQSELTRLNRLTIPAGVTEIDYPLATNVVSGVRIYAAGPMTVDTDDPRGNVKNKIGMGSVLKASAKFPKGQPLLRIRCRDLQIDPMSFDGRGLARCGLHFDKGGIQGFDAPGKSDTPWLTFDNFTETGIVMGTNPLDWHCDCTEWGRVEVNNTPRVMLVHNAQSMHHHFRSVTHNGPRVASFEFRGGGCLTVDSYFTASPGDVLLINEVRGTDPKTGKPVATIGYNNRSYTFGYVKIDDRAQGQARLVNVATPTTVNVRFRDGVYSGTKPASAAILRANSTLRLDVNNVPLDAVECFDNATVEGR